MENTNTFSNDTATRRKFNQLIIVIAFFVTIAAGLVKGLGSLLQHSQEPAKLEIRYR